MKRHSPRSNSQDPKRLCVNGRNPSSSASSSPSYSSSSSASSSPSGLMLPTTWWTADDPIACIIPAVLLGLIDDYWRPLVWQDSNSSFTTMSSSRCGYSFRNEFVTRCSSSVMRHGQWRWEVEMLGESTVYIDIGVRPAALTDESTGFCNREGKGQGWALDISDGSKYSHTLGNGPVKSSVPLIQSATTWGLWKKTPSTTRLSNNDYRATIGLHLDLDRGTLDFYANGLGGSHITGFDNVVGPVRPAVSALKQQLLRAQFTLV